VHAAAAVHDGLFGCVSLYFVFYLLRRVCRSRFLVPHGGWPSKQKVNHHLFLALFSQIFRREARCGFTLLILVPPECLQNGSMTERPNASRAISLIEFLLIHLRHALNGNLVIFLFNNLKSERKLLVFVLSFEATGQELISARHV
jgi:hypothetical protein